MTHCPILWQLPIIKHSHLCFPPCACIMWSNYKSIIDRINQFIRFLPTYCKKTQNNQNSQILKIYFQSNFGIVLKIEVTSNVLRIHTHYMHYAVSLLSVRSLSQSVFNIKVLRVWKNRRKQKKIKLTTLDRGSVKNRLWRYKYFPTALIYLNNFKIYTSIEALLRPGNNHFDLAALEWGLQHRLTSRCFIQCFFSSCTDEFSLPFVCVSYPTLKCCVTWVCSLAIINAPISS